MTTLRIHEIEGHGFSFEASEDGKYLGDFDRVEVYRHKAWNDASDALGYDAEYVEPDIVIEAGDEYTKISEPLRLKS